MSEPRTLDQNAKLHACITDISAQLEWAGQRWDIEDWKRLLTAAYLRAVKHGSPTIVPALDGQGFDVLYRRTSRMTKAEMSEFLEYILAWGTDHDVRWSWNEQG